MTQRAQPSYWRGTYRHTHSHRRHIPSTDHGYCKHSRSWCRRWAHLYPRNKKTTDLRSLEKKAHCCLHEGLKRAHAAQHLAQRTWCRCGVFRFAATGTRTGRDSCLGSRPEAESRKRALTSALRDSRHKKPRRSGFFCFCIWCQRGVELPLQTALSLRFSMTA
jgi:hypothetical protein